MQEYNNSIDVYQQMILKGKKIGEKEIKKIYDSNWTNLYNICDIYIRNYILEASLPGKISSRLFTMICTINILTILIQKIILILRLKLEIIIKILHPRIMIMKNC